LKHSIEIKTTPEKIWDFFYHIEQNYTIWHPHDHVVFTWTKGKPLEVGSTFYSEQYMMGKIQKYKGTVTDTVDHRKIVFQFAYPVSIFSPKIEWLITPKGSNTVFTAITHMRAGHLYQKLFKKSMKKIIMAHDKHVAEEGENLKALLEQDTFRKEEKS
jgi:uncharacterized protein YndB with AHSA1/START domain